MTTQHTPTSDLKHLAIEETSSALWLVRKDYEGDMPIAMAGKCYKPLMEEIVRAVNCHEALVTSLKEALEYLDDMAIDLDGEPEERLAGVRIRAYDALAKAQGKGE